MNVDYPTTVLYFVFAHTLCRLYVYTKDEEFAREVLTESGVREWLKPEDSKNWQDLDIRVWLKLMRDALPKMVEKRTKQAFGTIKL